MFGDLIARLDHPEVAAKTLAALDDAALEATIRAYATARDITAADCMAGIVRGFLDQADDDVWLQLVGIMGRSKDPGLAALHAILRHWASQAETRA
ncbi:hypothetical protein [Chelativorans intermedius]|uniref:Uncharacterized protein n=1 Tax=Chelativorans intermedius TaxID=515947 RepID=A0ABV6DD18_9HYPH|nr:hypothetical protein [Chelativorans intermedius]MCT9000515.1 hypothetical protein [Chelativorans intermedius]